MSVKLKPGVVARVPIAELEPDAEQPRNLDDFAPERLDRIGASLKLRQLYPLLVRQVGSKKIIFDGEVRWRSAKRVKIKELDCLLVEGMEDALVRGAGQIVSSIDRTPLNAIEIGEFLVQLSKRQKMTTNDMLAALDKAGVPAVNAQKLDKLMRLVELPAWVKDFMRSNKFSEAHGVAILPAIGYPAALNLIKEQVAQDMDWRGSVTAKEVAETVDGAFETIGIDLNADRVHGHEKRAFPIEACRKCQWYKKLSGKRGSTELCLNAKEYDRKNAEALQLQQEKEAAAAKRSKEKGEKPFDVTDPLAVPPRKLKPAESGHVVLKRMTRGTFYNLSNARFDVATCADCPHKRLASYNGKADDHDAGEHCFHPPCFDKKQSGAGRDESRREKLREYFEAWLRPVVLAIAPTRMSHADRDGLLVWLATGAPEQFHRFHNSQRAGDAARRTEPFLIRRKLQRLPDFIPLQINEPMSRELAECAMRAMTREQVRWFAQYVKIDLAQAPTLYRIDEDYLRMKRKGELHDLAKRGGLETVANLGMEELRQALLVDAVRDRIGVPADIEAVYRESFDAARDDEKEFDEMAREELLDEMFCVGCGCTETDPCETPSGPCSWLRRDWNIDSEISPSYLALGICSAPECKHELKAWDAGERKPTPKAIAVREERLQMMTGSGAGELADDALDEAITEQLDKTPTKKTKGKKAA
jgi:ParB/RepB/Spo0J family partition protein